MKSSTCCLDNWRSNLQSTYLWLCLWTRSKPGSPAHTSSTTWFWERKYQSLSHATLFCTFTCFHCSTIFGGNFSFLMIKIKEHCGPLNKFTWSCWCTVHSLVPRIFQTVQSLRRWVGRPGRLRTHIEREPDHWECTPSPEMNHTTPSTERYMYHMWYNHLIHNLIQAYKIILDKSSSTSS